MRLCERSDTRNLLAVGMPVTVCDLLGCQPQSDVSAMHFCSSQRDLPGSGGTVWARWAVRAAGLAGILQGGAVHARGCTCSGRRPARIHPGSACAVGGKRVGGMGGVGVVVALGMLQRGPVSRSLLCL